MNKEQIKALFPLKAKVTKEIIEEAQILNSRKCIEALTLKSVLPEKLKSLASWGTVNTANTFLKYDLTVTTIERVNMMTIKEPCTVTFILENE